MDKLPDNTHTGNCKIHVGFDQTTPNPGRSVAVKVPNESTGEMEHRVIELPSQPSEWLLNPHGDVVPVPIHSGQEAKYPLYGPESYYGYIVPKKLRQGFVPWEKLPPPGTVGKYLTKQPTTLDEWLMKGRYEEQKARRAIANRDAKAQKEAWDARSAAEAAANAQAIVDALDQKGAINKPGARRPKGEE